VSFSFAYEEQVSENDTQTRWFSILGSDKSSTVDSANHPNLRRDLFLGRRCESTAAESSASSSPPAERYEYQAEVWLFFMLYGLW